MSQTDYAIVTAENEYEQLTIACTTWNIKVEQ